MPHSLHKTIVAPALGQQPVLTPLFAHKIEAGFPSPADDYINKLMCVMDSINRRMGKGSMTIAASGTQQRWAMRRDAKSPNYTTDWDELPVAE